MHARRELLAMRHACRGSCFFFPLLACSSVSTHAAQLVISSRRTCPSAILAGRAWSSPCMSNRPISIAADMSLRRRASRAAVKDIARHWAILPSDEKMQIIAPACTAITWTAVDGSLGQMSMCDAIAAREAAISSARRCPSSSSSHPATDCTPATCQACRRRTAAFECRIGARGSFTTRCVSARP